MVCRRDVLNSDPVVVDFADVGQPHGLAGDEAGRVSCQVGTNRGAELLVGGVCDYPPVRRCRNSSRCSGEVDPNDPGELQCLRLDPRQVLVVHLVEHVEVPADAIGDEATARKRYDPVAAQVHVLELMIRRARDPMPRRTSKEK